MKTLHALHFEITIEAPRSRVWATALGDESYREWTSVFHAGSYYEGSWELGSEIRFLGPESSDSGVGGMLAIVVEVRQEEYVSVEYFGQVVRGVDDTTSDIAKAMAGAHESYTFTENPDGTTAMSVDLDSEEELVEMFADLWPKALRKLKEIAERVG